MSHTWASSDGSGAAPASGPGSVLPLGADGRSLMGTILASRRPLDAIGAEHVVGVGQLARVLHQEAGLAHELARSLRLDAAGPVAAVVGLGLLLVLVLVVVGLGRDAVLEDRVEVGFDVVVVVLVLLLLVVVVALLRLADGSRRRRRRHHLVLL